MTISKQSMRLFLVVNAAFFLSACGGTGPGATGLSPVPPAPPPPEPEPEPEPPAAEFVEIIEVDESQSMAVIDETGSEDSIAVRYDADQGVYLVHLPFGDEGAFLATGFGENSWSGTLADPSNADDQQLLYLTFSKPEGAAYTVFGNGSDVDERRVFFTTGIPTASDDVPIDGNAIYDFTAVGSTENFWYVSGTGRFNFDFSNGTFGGYFDAIADDNWSCGCTLGTYTFLETVYSVGANRFSGSMLNSENGHTGNFVGLFTGPSAEELMAQWSLTFYDYWLGTDNVAQGVLIGVRD